MTRSAEPTRDLRAAPELQPPPAPARWTLRLQPDLDRDLVGGKAAGLSRLLSSGFTTPRGFCVTTETFQHVLHHLTLSATSLEDLRDRLLKAELPRVLREEITAQMDFIGAGRWAVRSSAVDEDGESRSYAGQATTVLDVDSPDALFDALRAVWASHFQLESLLYRAQDRVSITLPPMAVLVQEMLDPEVAGVLFTTNPLTDDASEVVVSAARGTGEVVVAGRGGETHYLDKHSGYVLRQVTDRKIPLLSDVQLRELTSLARAAEDTLGPHRDLEWAYVLHHDHPSQPRLVLLQDRPITTDAMDDPLQTVWTNTNVGEALPGVATPMTWSIIEDFSRQGFEQAFGTLGLTVPDDAELVRSFRGRIYLNLSQFMSIASGQPLFKPERLFSMAGGGGVDLVRDIYEHRSRRGFFKRLPMTIPRVLGAQISMPLIAPLWGKYFTSKVRDFLDRDLTVLSREDLIDELLRLDGLFDRTGLIMLTTSSNFLMSYVVTAEFLRILGGEEAPRREQELISGLDVKSAEPGLALLEMGRMIRRSIRLRRILTDNDSDSTLDALIAEGHHPEVSEFLEVLDDFRTTYGHRAPREAELATPRWREDSSFLFDVLRSFVLAPHLPSSIDVQRDRKRTKKSARKFIDDALPDGLGVLFKGILSFTRSNARRREYMRDRVVDSLSIYRRFFLECGRRLHETGCLRDAEDVFYLTREELQAWLVDPATARDFPTLVLVRRALFDHFRSQSDPPDTFILRGNTIVAEEDSPLSDRVIHDESGSLVEIRGLPGSPGRVSGPARVILDPTTEDARIHPGEILVAPYTDVGWTPLFLAASGVVMCLGGPLSHSCIVAREYGIPAVVNARQATETISTGDWITVDGDRGLVYVRDDPTEEPTPGGT